MYSDSFLYVENRLLCSVCGTAVVRQRGHSSLPAAPGAILFSSSKASREALLTFEESHNEALDSMYSLNFKGQLYWNIYNILNSHPTNSKHHFENGC